MRGGAFPSEMSSADAVMWAIERDRILRSTVAAVAVLDRAPDHARLRRLLADASREVPRLRQVVVAPRMPGGRPRWADDPSFDIDFHLRRVRLPEEGGLDAVLDLARVSAMAGLDRQRPLWEFTVVEGMAGGQAAFIQKFHHCVTDGVGGIELALRVLDATRGGRARGAARRQRAEAAPAPPAPGGSDAPARPGWPGAGIGRSLAALGGRTGGLATDALAALTRPGPTLAALADNARWAARLLAPVDTPLSPVMRGRSAGWQFDAFDVELGALKAAAGVVGGSVNDVFLTAVTAGLRRYHEARGTRVERLRMTLPISIRRPGDPPGGNRFTPVRFVVPVGTGRDPAGTAREIGALVREWREGPAPDLTDSLSSALCRLPAGVLTGLFAGMLENVDFVATNIPGLPRPMYLAGAEMLRQYAFAPLSGAAVNVALLSHADWGCIGVNSDAAAVPDPERLGSCMRAGFAEALSVHLSSVRGTSRGVA